MCTFLIVHVSGVYSGVQNCIPLSYFISNPSLNFVYCTIANCFYVLQCIGALLAFAGVMAAALCFHSISNFDLLLSCLNKMI